MTDRDWRARQEDLLELRPQPMTATYELDPDDLGVLIVDYLSKHLKIEISTEDIQSINAETDDGGDFVGLTVFVVTDQ